jgi:hypothetical protein
MLEQLLREECSDCSQSLGRLKRRVGLLPALRPPRPYVTAHSRGPGYRCSPVRSPTGQRSHPVAMRAVLSSRVPLLVGGGGGGGASKPIDLLPPAGQLLSCGLSTSAPAAASGGALHLKVKLPGAAAATAAAAAAAGQWLPAAATGGAAVRDSSPSSGSDLSDDCAASMAATSPLAPAPHSDALFGASKRGAAAALLGKGSFAAAGMAVGPVAAPAAPNVHAAVDAMEQ